MPKSRLYSPRIDDLPEITARIFVQDPMISDGEHDGLTEITLQGEAFLGAGPTTSRIEVVDYDEDTDTLHAPAAPLSRRAAFSIGRKKPIDNFRLHQVNVWAIVTRTLDLLEDARVLGRRIPWAFPGGRLRVYPHFGYDENAYYDRETGALHFFYFEGENGPVYTCLSHDIVTHELGHAVLDGLKPLYNEIDGPESAGFHEYFGDALAMVSALTIEDLVKAAVREHPRALDIRNVISDIALEFGSRGAGHYPLRSAGNTLTMSDLEGHWEEHDYSEVLTGAFYDILRALYADEVERELERRDRQEMDGQIAVGSLISAARRTNRMLLRALDYLPPAGLSYVDYARAIFAADRVAYPVDDRGYRRIVYEAFKERGVIEREADLEPALSLRNNLFRDYDVDQIGATPTDAYVFLDANRELLQIPRTVNFEVHSLYRTRKVSAGGYFPPRELVLEFHWREDVVLEGPDHGLLQGEIFPLWCGGTLVFDSDGNVVHYVIKTRTEERERTLMDYLTWLDETGAFFVRAASPEDASESRPRAGHRIELTRIDQRIRATRIPAMRHAARRAGSEEES